MADILDITRKTSSDNSIRREEWHTYDPYSSTRYENSDEIRIAIHHQDIYTTPYDSSIEIRGKITKEDGSAITKAIKNINNGFAFVFEEIRYELFGVEIDKVRNAGITSTMKGYVSIQAGEESVYQSAGWKSTNLIEASGEFTTSIPLKLLLGFAEDYRRVIVNAKQELVLTRSRNDDNVYINDDRLKINIYKIQWRMKHVYPNDVEKLHLLNILSSNPTIDISFRNWELFEYPVLPIASRQIWPIKTTSQLETPRFVIIAFQTNIRNNVAADASNFDHCKLINVKLHLNSECFPYENLNINFSKNEYTLLYEMYAHFQNAYYNKSKNPILDWLTFKDKPMIVIDCSKQNESIKSGPIDIRLELESSENFPDNTTAYALVLHDKVVQYSPLTNSVNTLH